MKLIYKKQGLRGRKFNKKEHEVGIRRFLNIDTYLVLPIIIKLGKNPKKFDVA